MEQVLGIDELKVLAESVGRVDGVSFTNSVGDRQVDWFIRFSAGELVEFVRLVNASLNASLPEKSIPMDIPVEVTPEVPSKIKK